MRLSIKRPLVVVSAAIIPVYFSLGHAAIGEEVKPVISNPYYIRVDAGVAAKTAAKGTYYSSTDDYHKVRKNALTAGVGFGKHFNDFFRADLTLAHTPKYAFRAQDTAAGYRFSQDFNYTAAFVNGYVDLLQGHKMIPYVMGGAGYGRSVSSTTATCRLGTCSYYSGKKTYNPIWQVGAGVAYQWKENVAFDLGYRYANLGKVKTGKSYFQEGSIPEGITPEYLKLRSHMVTMGMRFNFR